jgi:hypothetical protein
MPSGPTKSTTQACEHAVGLVEKRVELLFQFMREVIADPSRLDEIPPSGSVVVILPADDPEFAAHERAEAERLAAEGRHVVLVTVGAEPISEEGWARLNAELWSPNWAVDLERDQPRLVYDQERDVLIVDFAQGRRRGWTWPHNELSYRLIDEETEEAFGYLVPDFLAKAVPHVPNLARALRIAELRPLNEPELAQLETIPIWHFEGEATSGPAESATDARIVVRSALDQITGDPVAV